MKLKMRLTLKQKISHRKRLKKIKLLKLLMKNNQFQMMKLPKLGNHRLMKMHQLKLLKKKRNSQLLKSNQ